MPVNSQQSPQVHALCVSKIRFLHFLDVAFVCLIISGSLVLKNSIYETLNQAESMHKASMVSQKEWKFKIRKSGHRFCHY